MQRVRSWNPDKEIVLNDELRRAIMVEAGTCPATYYNYRWSLIKLGWIKTRKKRFVLTGKDLTEDY